MNWKSIFIQEVKNLFSNPAVVFTVFGGIVIYSLLYPLPYDHQLPRELRVAVVDHDNSQQSRAFIQMLNATPQLNIVMNLSQESEASTHIADKDIEGVIVIPQHFYRDLLMGKSPVISVGGDASFFLVYGTIVEGAVSSGSTLGAHVKVVKAMMNDIPQPLAEKQYIPFSLNMVPVFNPSTGYGDYVVPGVFMLILQQTLLIASGMLQASSTGNGRRHLAVRTLVLFAIYSVMSMYYLGGSLSFNGVNRLAEPVTLAMIMVPFLLATVGAGTLIGSAIKRPEIITLTVLLSSMPLLFSSGFVWPISALPDWISGLAQLSPSTPTIQATIQLNQMGATLQSQQGFITQLWGLALLYLALAFVTQKRIKR
ncbi:ABC transporter permease [Enterovibrio nigricans]|uniref:ABC-2 type transport system permease protein n=1 Tax=Enterovibrio nigricans DSM 22720 TaxID=1121868 RepID=A0A1T4VCI5_9GAMM|nr:ABC transporter permease [Enterovibrio nigricans]SKA62623.1 ABC-2 type transport system permease protein [Enterovibrio nigricans DSM 22720]